MKFMSFDWSRRADSLDTPLDVFSSKGVAVIDEKLKNVAGIL